MEMETLIYAIFWLIVVPIICKVIHDFWKEYTLDYWINGYNEGYEDGYEAKDIEISHKRKEET